MMSKFFDVSNRSFLPLLLIIGIEIILLYVLIKLVKRIVKNHKENYDNANIERKKEKDKKILLVLICIIATGSIVNIFSLILGVRNNTGWSCIILAVLMRALMSMILIINLMILIGKIILKISEKKDTIIENIIILFRILFELVLLLGYFWEKIKISNIGVMLTIIPFILLSSICFRTKLIKDEKNKIYLSFITKLEILWEFTMLVLVVSTEIINLYYIESIAV